MLNLKKVEIHQKIKEMSNYFLLNFDNVFKNIFLSRQDSLLIFEPTWLYKSQLSNIRVRSPAISSIDWYLLVEILVLLLKEIKRIFSNFSLAW